MRKDLRDLYILLQPHVMDGQFVAGMSLIVFGALLILWGVALPAFMHVLLPVALVFIFGGVALKVISLKNLG